MKMDDTVRRGVTVLLSALVLACLTSGYAATRWHRAGSEHDAARHALAEFAVRAEALRQQSSRFDRLQTQLKRLSDSGFVVEDDGPRWMEALRQAQVSARIAEVRYEPIGEPVSMDSSNPSVYPHADARVAEHLVRLRFHVLHEGELLAFLDALRDAPAGVMRVRACIIERAQGSAVTPSAPLLSAQCDIGWSAAALVTDPAPR